MRLRLAVRRAALALGACAILVAAYSATASLGQVLDLASSLVVLDRRLGDFDSSLRGQAKGIAGIGREVESLETSLSKSISGRDELLSDISQKIDRIGRESALPMSDATVKDGRAESAILKDIALARSLVEADRCFAAGRFADAAARYSAVIEAVPGDARLRQRRAISLYRANPADSACYSLIEGDLRDPAAGENALALEVLALIAIERQRWRQALEYFGRLIELRPRDAKVLKEAGECALYVGEIGLASGYFDEACAADPGDEEAARLKARARQDLGSGPDR
jgi:tetratricopeptide (TPR) repeat protein